MNKPMGKRQQRRIETEAALVHAVGRVIARDGMDGLGVNAVAKEAGVDKVLIYRYFDGLPGVLRAFGESADFWPTVEEVVDEPLERFAAHGSRARLSREFMENYLKGIRSRPLCVEILAWEPANRNALTIELETTRMNWDRKLVKRIMQAEVGLTKEALVFHSILAAAMNYLVARKQLRVFGDLDLGSEEGWREVFDVIERALTALE
ncbi:MAG: TetR/AcrR family transcriptional regulator [Myxococcota bacterium]